MILLVEKKFCEVMTTNTVEEQMMMAVRKMDSEDTKIQLLGVSSLRQLLSASKKKKKKKLNFPKSK